MADHRVIHVESGGAFLTIVCACGALQTGAGITSVAALLSKHVTEALASDG